LGGNISEVVFCPKVDCVALIWLAEFDRQEGGAFDPQARIIVKRFEAARSDRSQVIRRRFRS